MSAMARTLRSTLAPMRVAVTPGYPPLITVVVAILALAAIALGAHPFHVLASVFVLGMAVLVVRRPHAALVLAFALIPLHEFAYAVLSSRYHISLQPFTYWKDALAGGLLVRGAWTRVRSEGWVWLRDPVMVTIIVFALLLVLAAVLSPDLVVAGYSLESALIGPALLVAVLLLRPPRRVIAACLGSVVVVGLVMAGAALWEQSIQDTLPTWLGKNTKTSFAFHGGNGVYRSGSLYGEPPLFAFLMISAIPVMIAVAALARGWWRVLAWVGAVVGVAGLAVTYTRSAMGGALLAIAVTIGLALRPRRVAVMLCLFVVVASGALAVAGVVAGDSRIVHTQEDNTAHFQHLQDDLDLLAQYPLGIGLGRIDFLGQRFNQGQVSKVGQSTESAFFNRGIEGGVAALVSYLVLLFVLGMRVRRVRLHALQRGDWFAMALGGAAVGSLLGYCVAGLNLPVPANTTLWGTLGLAMAVLPPAAARLRSAEE